jgi:hypothetical protein
MQHHHEPSGPDLAAIAIQRQRVLDAFDLAMDAFTDWGCLAPRFIGGGDEMEDDQYCEVANQMVYTAWVCYQNLYNTMIDEDGPWKLDDRAADFIALNPRPDR